MADLLAKVDLGNWLIQALDILVVTVILYSLILLARGTRAWKILSGLAVFGVIYLMAEVLQLKTLSWLLKQIVPLAPVALVILFYPELRYALEEFGRVRFWRNRLTLMPREDLQRVVGQIVELAESLSARRVGALIVIEREEGLDDLIASGVNLDAEVSSELLDTLFHPGSSLHDGAVILRGDRIVSAGCVLPLTDRPDVGSDVHTRHRAAIGVTERSDALTVVVSEESGAISLGMAGHLVRGLKPEGLRQRLVRALQPTAESDRRAPWTLLPRLGSARQAGNPGDQGG